LNQLLEGEGAVTSSFVFVMSGMGSIKQIHRTQVLVVGAGAAGVTSALAAGRNGAETFLVEYQGFTGGSSATLPWIGFHDRDYRQVVKGFAQEAVETMVANGDATPPCMDPKCGSIFSLNAHAWKILSMRLLREAGVKILLHAQMVDVIREGSRITGVIVECKSGRIKIEAEIVIDCSGDGDVAARGGVPWEKGRTKDGLVQAPTLVFRIGGVNRAKLIAGCRDRSLNYREWIHPHPEIWDRFTPQLDNLSTFIFGGFAGLIEKAREAGEFDLPQSRVVGVKVHREDEFCAVMTRVLGLDPTDAENLSNAYALVYEQIPVLLKFFRNWVPGFEDSHLREIAPILGIRESRRIVGDYVMMAEDVMAGQRFDDGVSMGGYHIDIHRPAGTWVESYNVKTYNVPLRSLIASDVENLMMAGKCISATHEAIASTRVIPICMGQGQGAGTAAALAVKGGKAVRDISVTDLRNLLREQGAEFGDTLGEPDTRAIDTYGQLPIEEPMTTGDNDPATVGAWLK